MPWPHHAYTENIPETPRKHTETARYECDCSCIELMMTDNCRYWLNHYLEITAQLSSTTWSFCQCSIHFCSTISMMHILCSFTYFVSNHFYNTRNPLAVLTPAGLKAVFWQLSKVHCMGSYGTRDKIYLIFSVHISATIPGNNFKFFAKLGPGVHS